MSGMTLENELGNEELFLVNQLFCENCNHPRFLHDDNSGCFCRLSDNFVIDSFNDQFLEFNGLKYCSCEIKYNNREKFVRMLVR